MEKNETGMYRVEETLRAQMPRGFNDKTL